MKRYKKYFMVVAALLASVVFPALIFGVPAKPGVRNFTQPDGSVISLRLTGDEFYHEYADDDGKAYRRDSDGYFREITSDEGARGRRMGAERRRQRRLPARVAVGENFSQVKHTGEVHVPVLLVEYQDVRFRDTHPLVTFRNFFADNTTSAEKYFANQSNGQFTPKFDIYGPVILSSRRTTYGGNIPGGGDRGVGRMVGEACEALDYAVDFSRYDYNGDGECDVVMVVYAGDGEASSSSYNAAEAVWPCQWDLESSDFRRCLYLDDTKVNMFAVFNELNGDNFAKIDGVGTFCHEFSHCLGLPDFYDTQYGPHYGMGYWSVMDHGSYNNDGYTPLGYSAYEKEYMGWLDIPEAEPNTRYTLLPMNNPALPTDMAVKITNPADENEFYILENRRKTRWDAYMPAEGMLITHFTYDADAWEQNYVNDHDMQRATLIPADNELVLNRYTYYGQIMYNIDRGNEATDLWPQEGTTEFTDSSSPAAKVNSGGFMSKPILDISRNDDGTVSFLTGDFQSGVKAIGSDLCCGSEEWWTLQGIRLESKPTEAGIYIRRRGAEVSKIAL